MGFGFLSYLAILRLCSTACSQSPAGSRRVDSVSVTKVLTAVGRLWATGAAAGKVERLLVVTIMADHSGGCHDTSPLL